MMNDRELLELAAKAAGVELKYDTFGKGENADRVYSYWNPLVDDGDALRLAVKLSILASPRFFHFRELAHFGCQDKDDCAATRQAIVRAAAEIGKKMGDE